MSVEKDGEINATSPLKVLLVHKLTYVTVNYWGIDIPYGINFILKYSFIFVNPLLWVFLKSLYSIVKDFVLVSPDSHFKHQW